MDEDFDEDEFDDWGEDWVCFEDTCVCDDGMCGESCEDDGSIIVIPPASQTTQEDGKP